MRYNKGAMTLIELIMVMVIVAVLSAAGGTTLFFVLQHAIFIPNKLNVEMVGQDIMDRIIEGENGRSGLRFARRIVSIGPRLIRFTDSDNQDVTFVLSGRWFSYQIAGGALNYIPYYLRNSLRGFQIEAFNRQVFTYYDARERITDRAGDVQRVKIEFRVRSGSGRYQDWQSQLNFASAVAIK
jgi:prepilin-type N-terminal cleavage/methylation domain-containing protein